MANVKYRILTPVGAFKVGDVVAADKFPPTTDFDRLVRLKAVHALDGSPEPVAENDLAGWKRRALAAEALLGDLKIKPAAQTQPDALNQEVDRLTQRVQELTAELDATKGLLKKATGATADLEAMKTVTAERDEARQRLAEVMAQVEAPVQTPDPSLGQAPPTQPDPNVVSSIMNSMDVPAIDLKLAELKIEVQAGANKMAKARALALVWRPE